MSNSLPLSVCAPRPCPLSDSTAPSYSPDAVLKRAALISIQLPRHGEFFRHALLSTHHLNSTTSRCRASRAHPHLLKLGHTASCRGDPSLNTHYSYTVLWRLIAVALTSKHAKRVPRRPRLDTRTRFHTRPLHTSSRRDLITVILGQSALCNRCGGAQAESTLTY